MPNKCYNCKFAGKQFKIQFKLKVLNMTYLHCQDPSQYREEMFATGEANAWDTLRNFYDVCEKHQLKPK